MNVDAELICMGKNNKMDSERRPLRILQSIGQEVLTLC